MAKIHRANNEHASGGRHANSGSIRRAYDYEADTRKGNGGYRAASSASRNAPHAASGTGRRISTAASAKQRRSKKSARRIVIVQLLASILLVFQIWRTQMLPAWMLVALTVVLILLWTFTVSMQKYPRRGALTRFCAWTLTAAMAIGCIFTQQGLMALQKITTGGDQTVIGVYVLADDPAKKIKDTEGYAFGCIAEMDRENTNKTITEVSAKAATAAQPAEFDNMFSLVDGLYNGQVQAIILNQSFVTMLEDEEGGYPDFSSHARCIYTCRLETRICLAQ